LNRIVLNTKIDAPIERCFNLSTSIDLHKISASKSKEQAIDGVTDGLIRLNETVTWKAKHFGFWHRMKVKITEYSNPTHFTDEMIDGSFKFMKHKHEFKNQGDQTIMIDTFEFASPLGIIGKIVDKLILRNYMTKFLIERNKVIKEFAETDKWKQVL
jgi:ligand-binding SRPBCC domain-containing protein